MVSAESDPGADVNKWDPTTMVNNQDDPLAADVLSGV
jgi:hypothetical protein